MKKTLRVLVVAVLGIFLVTGTAMAIALPVTIDFAGNFPGGSGTISTDGTDAWGSGIAITSVNVINAPVNGFLSLSGYYLSFDTRANANFINISSVQTSTAPLLGSVLLTGTFSSFDVAEINNSIYVFGTGPDVKGESLLNYFQIPQNTDFAFFGWSATASGLTIGDGITSGTAMSTDILNTAVPEPATMLLLGLGLLGVGIVSRKK